MELKSDLDALIASWLRPPDQSMPDNAPPDPCVLPAPADARTLAATLASLIAAALGAGHGLRIISADDQCLPEISNAIDLRLRPLCLVLPGASHARAVVLRATLSLLKSRLARAGGDSEGAAWSKLRIQLRERETFWRACLAWNQRGLEREAPPSGIESLYPVRIGPATVDEPPAEWTIFLPDVPPAILVALRGTTRSLVLRGPKPAHTTGLAHADATLRAWAEIEVLGQELAELELELVTARTELAHFTSRYHELIATRLAELDRLSADLARLRLLRQPDNPELKAASREANTRAEQTQREQQQFFSHAAAPVTKAQGSDLKKRYRQLAQKIHPDRATSESERAWRTQLMSEANRAYAANDAAALEEIFALWLEGGNRASTGGEGAVSSAPDFSSGAPSREADNIRRRLTAIAAELDQLYGSKLYELLAAARVAERQDRDLLHEMARRLDEQIQRVQSEIDCLNEA